MNLKRTIISLFFLFVLSQAFPQHVISWKFSLQDKGNGEIELVADATIQQGWHMYDSKIPDNGPYPTSLSFDEIKGAEAVGDFNATGKQATVKYDPVFQMNIGTFDNSARFIQRIKVTDKGSFLITGDVMIRAALPRCPMNFLLPRRICLKRLPQLHQPQYPRQRLPAPQLSLSETFRRTLHRFQHRRQHQSLLTKSCSGHPLPKN